MNSDRVVITADRFEFCRKIKNRIRKFCRSMIKAKMPGIDKLLFYKYLNINFAKI